MDKRVDYPIADEFVLAPLNTQEVEDVMMFLNHSCEPNVGVLEQIVFVAMQNIDGGLCLWLELECKDVSFI